MAFDVKQVVGDIADDIREKAQEMLDASQIDDRIAHAFRKVADLCDVAAGRVDDLDTDEVDDEGNPEPETDGDPAPVDPAHTDDNEAKEAKS